MDYQKEWAKRGAQIRLAELENERKAIYAAFPDLAPSTTKPPRSGARKTLSKAQRLAVSQRMKQYWAERRAKQQTQKK